MSELVIVVGGQAGSEGKGAICGALHRRESFDFAVRVGGPNAGHTIYDKSGRRFPLRQLPVAAVADPECDLVIAAGSEVDFGVLKEEIAMLEDAGHPVTSRLLIDREATVVSDRHIVEETGRLKHGTTGKGIGAARADRAMRGAQRVVDFQGMDLHTTDTQAVLREQLQYGASIMIEGTQGYVLGSHAGYYPHCTSGDCRAIDFMAAAGLPPVEADVVVVLRTHPIRIAGNSGPLLDETTWDNIGVEPEITTVTKKVRRVGEWNWDWARTSVDANRVNGDSQVALTFADYWWPELSGWGGEVPRSSIRGEVAGRLREIERKLDARIVMLGTGPTTQLTLEGEWD